VAVPLVRAVGDPDSRATAMRPPMLRRAGIAIAAGPTKNAHIEMSVLLQRRGRFNEL
jgi:hypothetical protein